MAEVKPKFQTLGKSKYVHVVRSKAQDLKPSAKGGSGCQQVRKYTVAGDINYKRSLSPEAASALDPCPQCDAKRLINIAMPKPSKEDKQAKRDETLKKIADSRKTDGQRKKEAKAATKTIKVKADKPKKSKGTSAGPRSTGGDSQSKADALVAFAQEHGWAASTDPANPGVVVTAVRGPELITCFFVDGKYDTTRHASLEVGDWKGKLRGVHGCRKQMAAEGRDKPHPKPGVGRSGPRKAKDVEPDVPEDESPEDAKRRVPFLLDDEPAAIMDAILGKTIRWRNGVTSSVEEAWLPAMARPKGKKTKRDIVTITSHPKTEKRMVNFLTVLSVSADDSGRLVEQYGPERSVYLDKIVRVIG